MADEQIIIQVTSEYQDGISSGLSASGSAADRFKRKIDGATKAGKTLGGTKLSPTIASPTDKATPTFKKVIGTAKSYAGKTYKAAVAIDDKATSAVNSIKSKLFNVRTALAATGVTAVAGSFVKSSISTYSDFSSKMSEVGAISGATGDKLEELNAKAKELGKTTKFTASESADAMKYMAMAGWSNTDIKNGIGGVLNLAAASGEDLGTTSDIVTDALTAFGKSASDAGKFADVLAAASSNSNTSVSMMGETFKYSASMAGSLGYSYQDVALATGLMANAGIKSSMAGTSLNSVMTRLATNQNGAQDAAKKLGVEFYNQDGSARALGSVMTDLRDKTKNMTAEEKSNFAKKVAGTNAQKGLLAILNASTKDYDKLSKAISGATDEEKGYSAATDMAEKMMDNLPGKWELFKDAIDGVKISMGELAAPHLMKGLSYATDHIVPQISKALESAMKKFDKFASKEEEIFKKLRGTKKWKSSDFFGKISLAWDKLISEPFSNWWESSGKEAVSSKIESGMKYAVQKAGEVLGDSLKDLLPGGDSASVGDYIVVALGLHEGLKVIKKIKEIYDSLFGGGSGGGSTISFPGMGSSVGSMSVTAGVVNVNGGLGSGGTTLPGAGGTSGTGVPGTSATSGGGLLSKIGGGATSLLGSFGTGMGSAATTAGGAAVAGGAGLLGFLGIGAGLASATKNFVNANKATDKKTQNQERMRGGTKLGMVGSGAVAGALVGSAVPVVGTAIGAAVGGGLGGVAALLSGNKLADRISSSIKSNKENQDTNWSVGKGSTNAKRSYTGYSVGGTGTSAGSRRTGSQHYSVGSGVKAGGMAGIKSTLSSIFPATKSTFSVGGGNSSKIEGSNKKLSESADKVTKGNRSHYRQTQTSTRSTKNYTGATNTARTKVGVFGSASRTSGSKVSTMGSQSATSGGQVSTMGSQASSAGGKLSSLSSSVSGLAGAFSSAAGSIRSAAARASAAASSASASAKKASSASGKTAKNASGGMINRHIVSELGEEGPEMVIPLSNHRSRALNLWAQAGTALGVRRHAKGGLVGRMPNTGISGNQNTTQGAATRASTATNISVGGVTIEVKVDGAGGGDIVSQFTAKKNEIADMIMDAIADACTASIGNRTREAM